MPFYTGQSELYPDLARMTEFKHCTSCKAPTAFIDSLIGQPVCEDLDCINNTRQRVIDELDKRRAQLYDRY